MKYILSICAFLFALDGVAQARALSKALADSPRAYALFNDTGQATGLPASSNKAYARGESAKALESARACATPSRANNRVQMERMYFMN